MENSLTIHDIRNKLSPICLMISLLELTEEEKAKFSKDEFDELFNGAIKQSKAEINYLAQREVYKNE